MVWKFQRALRLLSFSGVGVSAALFGIVARAFNADDVVLEINVFPFQSEKLSPAESAVDRQREKKHDI